MNQFFRVFESDEVKEMDFMTFRCISVRSELLCYNSVVQETNQQQWPLWDPQTVETLLSLMGETAGQQYLSHRSGIYHLKDAAQHCGSSFYTQKSGINTADCVGLTYSGHVCEGETRGNPQNTFSFRYLEVRGQRTSVNLAMLFFPSPKFSLTLERYSAPFLIS